MTLDLAVETYILYLKHKQQKEMDKLDYKHKNFCNFLQKGIIKKVKWQLTWCEKKYANHIAINDLVSTIYKELLNSIKQDTLFKKLVKHNSTFLHRRYTNDQ